jgi:hypothetical protein
MPAETDATTKGYKNGASGTRVELATAFLSEFGRSPAKMTWNIDVTFDCC